MSTLFRSRARASTRPAKRPPSDGASRTRTAVMTRASSEPSHRPTTEGELSTRAERTEARDRARDLLQTSTRRACSSYDRWTIGPGSVAIALTGCLRLT